MTEPKQVFHLSFESESELPMFAHLAVVGACHVNAWTSQFYRPVPDKDNIIVRRYFLLRSLRKYAFPLRLHRKQDNSPASNIYVQ